MRDEGPMQEKPTLGTETKLIASKNRNKTPTHQKLFQERLQGKELWD